MSPSQGGRRLREANGSSDALGLTLIAPAAIGLALVILFLGRGVDSRATVQVAAESAAQAAAQQRSPGAAAAAARSTAAAMLIDELTCALPSVDVDLDGFRAGGVVAVTVTCTVSEQGLDMISPPASVHEATAFATIDPLRATQDAP